MTYSDLINHYLSIDSILLLFIIIFAFIMIRELLTGLSKSHFKYIFILLIFIIALLSFLASYFLLGILFLVLGFVLLIGLYFIGGSERENKE